MPKQKSDYIMKFLLTLKEPYKANSIKLYTKYYAKFHECPASKSHHLNYPGGLYEHTLNVMLCIKEFYTSSIHIADMRFKRPKFGYSKCIYVAFLHDIGKIRQYDSRLRYEHHTIHIFDILREENIKIDADIQNSLYYHHGTFGSGNSQNMCALAILLHLSDMYSSQFLEGD